MHPSSYRPADLYLPCSPCRFQPASAFPALRAVPPGTSRTSSAGRSTRYRPDLVFPPSRRHLPSRSAAVPPVPDPSAHPAASSRHLLSLLSLPLRRHLLSCSRCRFQLVHTPLYTSCINKLYLNSLKLCLSLRWGPNPYTNVTNLVI